MEDDKAETDVRSYSNTYHANKSWWHWILLFSRGFPLVFLFHEMLPFSYWLSRAHGPRAPIIIHGNGKHRVAWTKTVWALVLPAHVTGLPTHPSFLATEAGTRIPIGPSCGGGCRFPLWPHRPYPPPFIFPPNGAHINVIKAASCSVQFLRFSRISACDVITSEWASCNESSLACLFQFSSPTDRVITRRNSRKTTASDCPWKTRTWAWTLQSHHNREGRLHIDHHADLPNVIISHGMILTTISVEVGWCSSKGDDSGEEKKKQSRSARVHN